MVFNLTSFIQVDVAAEIPHAKLMQVTINVVKEVSSEVATHDQLFPIDFSTVALEDPFNDFLFAWKIFVLCYAQFDTQLNDQSS